MWGFLYALALLPLWSWLNYVRGGAIYWVTDKLPGRALYYVAAIYGLTIWPISNWQFALAVFIGFMIAMAPGWGLWYYLGRKDTSQDKRRKDPLNKFIDSISFGSDHIALFWRHSMFVAVFVPALIVSLSLPWFWLAMVPFYGIAVVGAYEFGHRYGRHAKTAELIVGAYWWMMCFLSLNFGE